MSVCIKTQELSRRYGDLLAVDAIDLTIDHSRCFGLLGPNGAGKTTTLGMMSTLIKPTSGEAWVDGLSTVASPLEIKARIGVVPQQLALYEELSGRENLRFFGRCFGLRGRQLEARVAFCLELSGLESRASHRVNTYSGGMKRRLNLAAALVHDPQICFMDEPTVGIDAQSRNHIFMMIEQLRTEGRTVVYTTHYMEEAQRLCDELAIMDQGRIIARGTADEIVARSKCPRQIQIELASGSDPQEVAALLEPETLRIEGHSLRLTCDRPAAVLGSLLERLEQHAIEPRSVRIHRPDLEQVFLELTGRALRD